MAADNMGELFFPRHCRASVSPDKRQLALTFSFEDRAPVTIVLPLLGAARLQRNIAQCLYLLGVRSAAPEAAPEAAVEPETAGAAAD